MNMDWCVVFSEPVRVSPRRHTELFSPNVSWFGITTSPFLEGWLYQLSLPIWAKPPLPVGAIPHFVFPQNNYVNFSFALVEQGDTAVLLFEQHVPEDMATVSITEIESYTASITIWEIRYDRGYS